MFLKHAHEAGPIPAGYYRVVVLESDLRLTHRDFISLEQAKQYADDAASETDDNPPIVKVFDAEFTVVYEGSHYAAGHQ